jgi:DNA-binding NarL/FixJ family response regulator
MLTRRRRYHPPYDRSGAASRCGGVLLPRPRPLELALAAEGRSNPQIGERLYISRRTVQTHVAHIFMKLGISSRAQLAAEVIRQPGRG